MILYLSAHFHFNFKANPELSNCMKYKLFCESILFPIVIFLAKQTRSRHTSRMHCMWYDFALLRNSCNEYQVYMHVSVCTC